MDARGGEGIALSQQQRIPAVTRFWRCPRCTLHLSLSEYQCSACGFQRTRHHHRQPAGSTGGQALGMALRAAVAGMAGLALGRASANQGIRRLAVTALAVAAVPAANLLLGRLLGQRGGSTRTAASGGRAGGTGSGGARSAAAREQRRRQLQRAAAQVVEEAAGSGSISDEERRLLDLVMQPADSRTDRMRIITGVLQWLRQVEADPAPRSRSTQLVSALVVYELSSLVEEMSYEELYEAFGGHPPAKGLAQDQIAALPETLLTAEGVAALQSCTCAVCLDTFQPGDTARVLPACSHTFHASCLDPWLQSKALCPVCRCQVEPPGAAPSTSSC